MYVIYIMYFVVASHAETRVSDWFTEIEARHIVTSATKSVQIP